MGNLSDAMQSIVDEIRSATEARRAAFRQLMEDIGVRLSEIRSDTRNLTERFRREDDERKGAVGEMLGDFRKADDERKGAVGEMLGDFRKADDERKGAVGELKASADEMVEGFTSDHRQAHQIWAGRLKGKIKPEAVRKIKPKTVVEEAKEEPAVEAAPPTKEKILEIISSHPEGIRLIDIGNELGVDWRILIGPSKSLVDGGQVEKIENMYYPKKEE